MDDQLTCRQAGKKGGQRRWNGKPRPMHILLPSPLFAFLQREADRADIEPEDVVEDLVEIVMRLKRDGCL